MQTEVCFCTCHYRGALEELLLAHADHLLCAAPDAFRPKVIAALKTMGVEIAKRYLRHPPPICNGLMIEDGGDGNKVLPKERYIKGLTLMMADQYIWGGVEVKNFAELRIKFRPSIGSRIWAHQARPSIGFASTQMPNSSAEACKSTDAARELRKRYNKIDKFTINHPRKTHYTRPEQTSTGCQDVGNFLRRRIIALPEAVFS